jgi:sulfoxide reductase catalytic subunit YedY
MTAGVVASACAAAAETPTPAAISPGGEGGVTPGAVATPKVRGYVAPGTLMANSNDPGFYVRFIQNVRAPDPARWQLTIKGLVEAPTTMTLDHIKNNLAFVEQNTRMKCVEGWSSRAVWGGFTYAALADLVKPLADATHLYFASDDGYYEILPISELLKPRALFVTHMDGQMLGAKYGAPLRMILPWLYGYKGAKTINTLEFRSKRGQGYWSDVGPYSADGLILAGSDTPLDLDGKRRQVQGGEVTDY